MKYCLRYANDSKLKTTTEEISIQYNNELGNLVDFLMKHQEQRVILIINDPQKIDYKALEAVTQNYPTLNFAICFGEARRPTVVSKEIAVIIEDLKEANINFFMGDLITTGEQLQYYLELGVSDVYLTEDICFNLDAARRMCDRYGVQIRAFPNVAQSSIQASPALKKFFIRPEDVTYYESYIDVLEFWGDLERQDVFYLIYAKKGRWPGELKEIIYDFDASLDSRRTLPVFAPTRATCKKRCALGYPCHICDSIQNISQTMAEKGMYIKTPKHH